MPKPILIGLLSGYMVFAAACFLLTKNPGWLEAALMGIPGAVVGGLIGIPFWLVLRANHSQSRIDQDEGIAIEDTVESEGLWKFRSGLVIDPDTAVFPSRCIFTNEPVNRLLPFTIVEVEHAGSGPVVVVSKKDKNRILTDLNNLAESSKEKREN